jgi:hypothetical protein
MLKWISHSWEETEPLNQPESLQTQLTERTGSACSDGEGDTICISSPEV